MFLVFTYFVEHTVQLVNIYILYSILDYTVYRITKFRSLQQSSKESMYIWHMYIYIFHQLKIQDYILRICTSFTLQFRAFPGPCAFIWVQSTELGTAAAFSNHFFFKFRSVVICKPRWEDAQLRSSVTGVCSSIKKKSS